MPGIDLGFGVAQIQDYGGPFSVVSAENPGGRPFFLDQPIVTAQAAAAAGTNLSTLIGNALSAHGPGFGGTRPSRTSRRFTSSPPAPDLMATATGRCSTAELAGNLATTAINPGASGDVPPFSSNVGLTSGSLGGMGWRPGCGAHRYAGHGYRSGGLVRGQRRSRPRSRASEAYCPRPPRSNRQRDGLALTARSGRAWHRAAAGCRTPGGRPSRRPSTP